MSEKEKLKEVKHPLQVIELENAQITYIVKECKINTPERLKKWKVKIIKDASRSGNKFNGAEYSFIINLIKWHRNYTANGCDDIKEDFTEEVWDMFEPDDYENDYDDND